MFQIKEYPLFMYPHIYKNKCSDKTIVEYSVDESMCPFDIILNALYCYHRKSVKQVVLFPG